MRYYTLAEIHNLSMMDTEYIALAPQGYDPKLECHLKNLTHLVQPHKKVVEVLNATKLCLYFMLQKNE
ncbi:hypothetical protein ANSO36C_48070 [Nostoc cf. commune SO-36]|uniref:Uncharacterized protein n=1 Tax=Nostoc cf. commune SO-36 TaxID=449208 RepID=A0ABN6Q847_NOSCO|nr:hypothetical protein ANSO36C_48070 [Nostoc cf. commune SO-36]